MTERFKPIKPLPEDSMGVKSAEEKMVEQTKKTPKGAMKRVGKFKGGMLKGGQKKLDVNKDGKISGEDFAMLRGKKMVQAEDGKMIIGSEKKRPLPMLRDSAIERRSQNIENKAKSMQKKMGGGMMMQEPMGYKKGGGVRGGRAEMKGLRPAKMF
jgi:hypothetical protein